MPLLVTAHLRDDHSSHEHAEGVTQEGENVKHYESRFRTELNSGVTVAMGLDVIVVL